MTPRNFSHSLMKQLRAALPVALWAGAALALRPVAPWLFWATLCLLPAWVLYSSERKFFRSGTGKNILGLCGIMLVVHIIWAIIRCFYYDASVPDDYWLDDRSYYRESVLIADAWRNGDYPDISLKGSPPYLGTLHVGYHRALALVFLITGPSTLAGLLLNALCSATFPLWVGLSCRYLWQPAGSPEPDHWRQNPALLGALLAALHPTQFFWAAYLLKDTLTAGVFLMTLTMILATYYHRSAATGIATIVLMPYLVIMRIYCALALAVGAVLPLILKVKTKTLIYPAAIITLGGMMIANYTTRGGQITGQIFHSILSLASTHATSPAEILIHTGTGIPRLFMAPYAWLIFDFKDMPLMGLYPGMWYLYLIGLPLGFAGLYAALRRNITLSIIPLTVFGLIGFMFLAGSYGGDAARQRFFMEYIILIFAAYGIMYPSRWWILSIIGLQAMFAVGQVLSLSN